MLMMVLAERRYRRASLEFAEDDKARIGGGSLPLLVAVTSVSLGLASLAVLHNPS